MYADARIGSAIALRAAEIARAEMGATCAVVKRRRDGTVLVQTRWDGRRWFRPHEAAAYASALNETNRTDAFIVIPA